MDTLCKIAAVSLLSLVPILTLRKQNQDLAMLTALAAGLILLTALLQPMRELYAFWQELEAEVPLLGNAANTLWKCVGVGIVSQLCAQQCRDCGEGALAAKVELAGTFLCLVLTIPMIRNILEILREMV